MVVAQVGEFWRDLAVYAGAIVAVIAAAGALARLRPVRFAARKVIGEPLVSWVQTSAVQPILDKHQDEMTQRMERIIGKHTEAEESMVHEVVSTVGRMQGTLAKLGEDLGEVKAEQARVADQLEATGN